MIATIESLEETQAIVDTMPPAENSETSLHRSGVAMVHGKEFKDLPDDLYIPPEALEVFLEAFEGPLDLLLYLIRRKNLDILEIPIAEITYQYIEYIELMGSVHLELTAEYLVMAATLAEIKSRLLLPRSVGTEEEEVEDPRAELIRRLQEYERYKIAAQDLDEIPRMERDIFTSSADLPELKKEKPLPDVMLKELLLALKDVLKRVELNTSHQVQKESLSLRERMSDILEKVSRSTNFAEFSTLFSYEEGRLGVVVTFIAVLELLKQSMIELVQTQSCGSIHVKAVEV